LTDEARLRIEFPIGWEPTGIDPEGVAAWLDTWLTGEVDPADRRQLETSFRAMLIEARAEGLVLASGMVDVIQPEGAPVPQVVAASGFVVLRPSGRLEGALSPVAWHTAIRGAEADGILPLVEAPVTFPTDDVDFVKAKVMETLEGGGGPPVTVFGINYYGSTPDGTNVLTVGFRTPTVWLIDEFEALFDEIVRTVRVIDETTDATSA